MSDFITGAAGIDWRSQEKMRDARMELVEALKNSGKPVVIYGNGKFAVYAAKYLIEKGIEAVCFAVDKTYYKSNKIDVDGKEYEIKLVDDLKEASRDYNVLSGIIDYKYLSRVKEMFKESEICGYLDAVPFHQMDMQFIEGNKEIINYIYERLEDQESKDIMEGYLKARRSGDVEEFCKFNKKTGGYAYDLLELGETDVLVDGGAYTGDTIQEILNYTQGVKKVYAFEPDKSSYSQLESNCKKVKKFEIECFNLGLYSENTILRFEETGGFGSSVSVDASGEVKVISLDAFFNNKENITAIKMDIEGSELKALEGGRTIITKNMPKLAICIYHNNADLIYIFDFIDQISQKAEKKYYKIYMRQHSNSVEETVLYAIPYDRKQR